jgi:hypothetical protein
LTGAQLACSCAAARECKIIHTATSTLKAGKQAGPGVRDYLELDRSSCLLLNNHGSSTDRRSGHEGADLDLHQIAASKLAIDGQVEKRPVPHPALTVQKEAD